MDPKTAQILLGAAGSGGAAAATYVDDVFSTFLFDGNGSSQQIQNGIDLSGEGGLVWIKRRNNTDGHRLFDTERASFNKYLNSSDANAETFIGNFGSTNSDGFTMSASATGWNETNGEYCSWTFRKAPGFFDVVTYTGNGSARTIAHSLGSAPGMILIKGTSQAYDWKVYHRVLGADKYLVLNSDSKRVTSDTVHFNNTEPTSTHFSLGTAVGVNANGESFVAYLFAHDDQSFGTDGDEAIIKCGSYTGNNTSGRLVDVGFEPQFLLWKNGGDLNSDWRMFDIMRGFADGYGRESRANEATADLDNSVFAPDPSGFRVNTTSNSYNGSSYEYLYVAIRRPHKPPETATDVFDVNTESNDNNYSTTGFPVDAAISSNRDGSSHTSLFGAKLMGENVLRTGLTGTQNAYITYSTAYAFMDKFRYAFWGPNNNVVNYAFKRAPGFFDVVLYTGTGSAGTFAHSLGAEPELLIVRSRNQAQDWMVYSKPTGNSAYFRINKNESINNNVALWNNATPTSSVFSLAGDGYGVNNSGIDHVAFLFASFDGISKIGTYTGTGSAVNVDCGFTAGARFVLIKRTDSSGNWMVFDSERGIVSGNDPFHRLNLINAENTSNDMIDPLNAGFSVASGSTDVNASGGTYLFLAIA